MPALDESRRRLISVTEGQGASPSEVVEAVESDAALAIAVMRAANNGDGPSARVGGVREAVDALSPAGVRTIAGRSEHLRHLRRRGDAVGPPGAVPPTRGRHPPRRRSGRRGRPSWPARRAGRRRPASRCRPPGRSSSSTATEFAYPRGEPGRAAAPRAPRARHRPRPGRRRARAPLGTEAGDRGRRSSATTPPRPTDTPARFASPTRSSTTRPAIRFRPSFSSPRASASISTPARFVPWSMSSRTPVS